MMSSVCKSLTKVNSKLLQCHKGVKVVKHGCGISRSFQTQRGFTRSMWHMGPKSQTTHGSEITPRVSGWPKTCGCCGLHTEGDKEMSAFLKEEIELEKKTMKDGGKLPMIKDFEVTHKDGASLTLTRITDIETVTIKLNVNHSVEDSSPDFSGEPDKQEAPPVMVSRPPFLVEITKSSSELTLAIQCGFPVDEMSQPEAGEEPQYMDMIEIQDVALLPKGQSWEDNVYTVSGHVMDGNLYDMMLNMLEERGVDGDFVDQMVTLSTTYEHTNYVGFLEKLQAFMGS